MEKRKGLWLPNVVRIIELLKEKERDNKNLASMKNRSKQLEWITELDIRTIVKILATQPVQAAKLEEVAAKLGVPFEEIAEESTSNPSSNASHIHLFESWKSSAVAALIAGARSSIEVIDSILFLDLQQITDLIVQAAHANAHLEVSIYMASPSNVFGAQRSREMRAAKDRSVLIPVFQHEISAEKEKYESLFVEVESRINQQLDGLRFEIFEYLCMPSIRIIAIDRARFVFGFFPLFERNPNFPCFFLDKASATGTEAVLLERLANQIKNTKKVSIPRSSSRDANRTTAPTGRRAK